MEVSSAALYQQNIDKQRIVITGQDSKLLTRLITEVLSLNKRKFNHFADGKLTTQPGATVLIIESQTNLLDFQHHVAVLTQADANSIDSLTQLADHTPKAGTLIYTETVPSIKAIGSKERADVQSISYKILAHKVKDGKTFLISSTNEEFPIQLSGEKNLLILAAAKELLKKIGISSGQFYKAVSSLSA